MADPEQKEKLPEIIKGKCRKRLEAEQEKQGSIFFGLGLFGTVGWCVAIPTVLGTLLGRWLDTIYQSETSWTITGLIAGLAVGCLVAWRWLNRQGGGEQ
ncbi:MAG: AtpZ/AtpI family protein [Thermodesulfobacteriota bacterium]